MSKPKRLGIIGNSAQVRQHYLPILSDRRKLPCDVEIAWVSDCRCESGPEYDDCPFRAPEALKRLPVGATLRHTPPCQSAEHQPIKSNGSFTWKHYLAAESVDAVIISTPNTFHLEPIEAFLARGVSVAVDKPPVTTSADAERMVKLANEKGVRFATLAQRRYEDVYRLMLSKITSGAIGPIELVSLVFVHGWTPEPGTWRHKRSLAGGGVLIDSVYNCLDVVLWLLSHSDEKPVADTVHAYWNLQDEANPDSVELRATVGVRFDTGCLLSIVASSTAVARASVDENLKIFGKKGTLRYQRDKISRASMAAGQLTFQSDEFPQIEQVLLPAGQSEARRDAPLLDFLDSLSDLGRSFGTPTADAIPVLRIIEKCYESARQDGILIKL